jgi:predicted phosphohydrolase
MRLAWATDVHLNFLFPAQVEAFAWKIAAAEPDALLLTGDIAEAPSVEEYLVGLAESLKRPIYFVLGNHDFYQGSIAGVREEMASLSRQHPWLRWMNDVGVIELTPETGLVGHDGWADGRLGRGADTPLLLNDFSQIEELTGLGTADRFARLAALGDETADYFRRVLPAACERFRHVLLLTHVPPFREACWHEGRVSGDDYLPLFAARAAGEALLEVMGKRPECDLTVLCGHTHGEGRVEMLPNLRVWTGGAEYGMPGLQPLLNVA